MAGERSGFELRWWLTVLAVCLLSVAAGFGVGFLIGR